MNEHLVSKIINLCVSYMDVGEGREQERKLCKLSNSPAITCVSRLDPDNFESQSDSIRINQRFLSLNNSVIIRTQVSWIIAGLRV